MGFFSGSDVLLVSAPDPPDGLVVAAPYGDYT